MLVIGVHDVRLVSASPHEIRASVDVGLSIDPRIEPSFRGTARAGRRTHRAGHPTDEPHRGAPPIMLYEVLESPPGSVSAPTPQVESSTSADHLERGAPFFAVDRQWRVTLFNRNHERLTGLRREDVLGRRCWDAFTDIAGPDSPFPAELYRARREQVEVHFEARLPSVGVWTSVSAHPSNDGGLGVFVRDITAAKSAEEALRQSAAFHAEILLSVIDGITVLDREGNVRWMNAAWRQTLNLDETAALAVRSWLDHWRGDDHAAAELALATARVGSVGHFVGSLPTAQGGRREWDVVVAPMRSDAGAARSLLATARAVATRVDTGSPTFADEPVVPPEASTGETAVREISLREIVGAERMVLRGARERHKQIARDLFPTLLAVAPDPEAASLEWCRSSRSFRLPPTDLRRRDADAEMSYHLPVRWKRRLFLAMCRRYGLEPYRRSWQRRSIVEVSGPRRFLSTTLWPEYLVLVGELEQHLAGVADRVIRAVVHPDLSEAVERESPTGLPGV